MDIIKVIILGIIEGITEWLPISSTGHMILVNEFLKLNVTEEAKKYILEKGTDIKYGARPLRRAIQRYIEDEISEMILKGELQPYQTMEVTLEKENLKFTVK